jgi:hypothetical protein
VRAELLETGGPKLWAAFMDELRTLHLGAPPKGPSVLAKLRKAFEQEMAKSGRTGRRP